MLPVVQTLLFWQLDQGQIFFFKKKKKKNIKYSLNFLKKLKLYLTNYIYKVTIIKIKKTTK
jgi:hypothetical protein